MSERQVIDIHVHLGGTGDSGSGCQMSPEFMGTLAFVAMLIVMEASPADVNDQRVKEVILNAVNTSSKVDHAVLLALDGVYKGGKLVKSESHLLTPNDVIIDIAKENPRVLFGASVHPYRKKKELLAEVTRCIESRAVLFKWVPSSQQIDPWDERCLPFYEALAEAKIPLLCHTGAELAIPTSDPDANKFNDPRRLKKALEAGVRVIAAHCATPYFGGLMPADLDYFEQLIAMLRSAEKKGWDLYADISAFCTPTRIRYLRRINKEISTGKIPPNRFLYGSDFPIPIIDINVFKDQPDLATMLAHLKGQGNPLDRNYSILEEFGIHEAIFTNAWDLLPVS